MTCQIWERQATSFSKFIRKAKSIEHRIASIHNTFEKYSGIKEKKAKEILNHNFIESKLSKTTLYRLNWNINSVFDWFNYVRKDLSKQSCFIKKKKTRKTLERWKISKFSTTNAWVYMAYALKIFHSLLWLRTFITDVILNCENFDMCQV